MEFIKPIESEFSYVQSQKCLLLQGNDIKKQVIYKFSRDVSRMLFGR